MHATDISIITAAFTYDPSTGVVTWGPGNGRMSGKAAGKRDSDGYVRITLRGVTYKAHRIAWALHFGKWPELLIDHINGVKSDNRICNLRQCTNAENMQNIHAYKSPASGATGVYKYGKRFLASVMVGGVNRRIGVFDTVKDAAGARAEHLRMHHPFSASA